MMEDTATAEIARAQLWQWIHHASMTDSGKPVTLDGIRSILADERAALSRNSPGRWDEAAEILGDLIGARDFPEFLTLAAYGRL
jgi:malate synthase